MNTTRESPEETRARLLYMQLRAGGWSLSKQQYKTIKGWILAGQLDLAERAMDAVAQARQLIFRRARRKRNSKRGARVGKWKSAQADFGLLVGGAR